MCGKGGEQPLEKFEFCNLGSINLDNDKLYNEEENDINWDLFKDTIKTAIRFLDDVIDVNEYVLPQFEKNVLGNRKIGLGVTGLAHLLIKLGISYDSQEALDIIDKIFSFKKKIEEKYNQELALEKGNFPTWHESIFYKLNVARRNATISTQAPVGSVSTILNTESYGIEPLFGVGYVRRIVGGEIFEVNQLFKKMLHKEINNNEEEQKIIQECINEGTTNLPCVPNRLKELFRCANDISYKWHIKVMAQLQKYYNNAISKTVNLPESATLSDVKNAYILAYNNLCKGVTVYRNNSRQNQTIQIGNKSETKHRNIELPRGFVVGVDDSLIGRKRKLQTGCGSLHVEAFFSPDTGDMMEIYLSKGSTGGCNSFMVGLSRMISLALRGGLPIEAVIDQLNSVITCPSYAVRQATKKDTSVGKCCPDAIGKTLYEMQKEMWYELLTEDKEDNVEQINIINNINNNIFTEVELQYKKQYGDNAFVLKYMKCPECGCKLDAKEGCYSCSQCFWSKCN